MRDRPLPPETPGDLKRAATLMLGAMAVIGLIDNFVTFIAAEAGLWQFHATRAAMALPILVLVCLAMGWRLRPRRWRPVLLRSLFITVAMLIYFACLAVLPIGQVTAGLFTSPIFVLLISALFLGERIGPRRVVAVALGFAGILLIARPAGTELSVIAALPVLAGALYAVGVIGTRHWCAGESAASLLGSFFLVLGLSGAVGAVVVVLLPETLRAAAPEAAAFVLRPWETAPGAGFWLWTLVQAVGSLLAVGMIVRAYQLVSATRMAPYEYSLLVFASLWALVLKGEALTAPVLGGMAAIVAAGLVLARAPVPAPAPVAGREAGPGA